MALNDQWYLPYGDEEWAGRVSEHVNSDNFKAYSQVSYRIYILQAFESDRALLVTNFVKLARLFPRRYSRRLLKKRVS